MTVSESRQMPVRVGYELRTGTDAYHARQPAAMRAAELLDYASPQAPRHVVDAHGCLSEFYSRPAA
jgi:hypothetical protein